MMQRTPLTPFLADFVRSLRVRAMDARRSAQTSVGRGKPDEANRHALQAIACDDVADMIERGELT